MFFRAFSVLIEFMEENTYCIYRHLKPCGEVFYIGIGKDLKRPYNKISRSKYWKNKVKKYPNYEVQILKKNMSKEEACELEIILISWYKRIDCCGGTLVNLTDGGESTSGRIMEQWQRDNLSKNQKGTKLGKENPNYGNTWTDAQKDYMSNLKKEGYKDGTLKINREGTYKGIEERNRRWKENPQLKVDMINKVSKIHNLYQYLKIDRETKEILETFESRLEILDRNPTYKTSPLLSVCNGWKSSYKGFIWRYRVRDTGEILDFGCKYCK